MWGCSVSLGIRAGSAWRLAELIPEFTFGRPLPSQRVETAFVVIRHLIAFLLTSEPNRRPLAAMGSTTRALRVLSARVRVSGLYCAAICQRRQPSMIGMDFRPR